MKKYGLQPFFFFLRGKNFYKEREKWCDSHSIKADFNLGDALYKQKKYTEAEQQFQKVAAKAEDDKLKASAYHNLGNSLLESEKYEESTFLGSNSPY